MLVKGTFGDGRTPMGGRAMSAERDMLSPREIAERVGLSYHAILRSIKRGDLRACEPIPGRLLVDVAEYDRWRMRPAQQTPARSERRSRPRAANRGSFASELRAIEGGQ